MYCASVLSRIHVAVHHGSHGLLGFILVPLSSLSKSCAAAASKSFSVKDVQTPHRNSGNSRGGWYREYNPDSAGTRRDELSNGRLTRLVLDRLRQRLKWFKYKLIGLGMNQVKEQVIVQ